MTCSQPFSALGSDHIRQPSGHLVWARAVFSGMELVDHRIQAHQGCIWFVRWTHWISVDCPHPPLGVLPKPLAYSYLPYKWTLHWSHVNAEWDRMHFLSSWLPCPVSKARLGCVTFILCTAQQQQWGPLLSKAVIICRASFGIYPVSARARLENRMEIWLVLYLSGL